MATEKEIVHDVNRTKNLIDSTQTDLAKSEGAIETNMKRLKSDFDIGTIKEANAIIEDLKGQEEGFLTDMQTEHKALMEEVDLES